MSIDCLLDREVDETWTFLSALTTELVSAGHIVFDGSGENRLSGIPNVKPLHESSGPLDYPIETGEVLRLKDVMQEWGVEKDFAEVEEMIRSSISALRANEVTHVITWGPFHYRSQIMSTASKHLGLECLTLERGLIPNSWIMSKNQWLGNLVQLRSISKAELEYVRKFAIYGIDSFNKYPVSLPRTASNESHGKSINIYGGFPTAGGLHKEEYENDLENLLSTLVTISEGISIGFRPHPGYFSAQIPAENAVDLQSGRISETFTDDGVNIFLGTTTSAMAVLYGLPTVEISTPHQKKEGFVHQVKFPLPIEKIDSYETLESHAQNTFDNNLEHILRKIGESHIFHPIADGGSSIHCLIKQLSPTVVTASKSETSESSWETLLRRSGVLVEIASGRLRHEELKEQYEGLKEQYEGLKEQYEGLKEQYESVLISASWKLTQPLRKFLAKFRK